MVHGFNDTCSGAFEPDTRTFFATSGWDPTRIRLVGYYNDESGCTYGDDVATPEHAVTACDHFIFQDHNPLGIHYDAYGTLNDPIRHLACLLAWYISTTYTQPTDGSSPRPVVILAHSMGGLIVRDALGES